MLGRLAVLTGLLGVAAFAIPASAAVALPSDPPPRVSVAIPAEVGSGESVVATGRVISFERRGSVQLQTRRYGRWRPLAAAALRHGRFRIRFALAGAAAVSIRAALRAEGRTVASSRAKLVLVRPVAPPPAPLPAPAAVTFPSPAPPPAGTIYWGAWIGPQFTGTAAPDDMSAVAEFEKLSRKRLSLLETFSSWAFCSGDSPSCQPSVPFPRPQLEAMRGYGALPVYSWASGASGGADEQSQFQLADIIAGNFDSYLRGWAEEAKAWGHPFLLRFDWEMNGDWFPWSEGLNGNQPGEFVAAWRHVHDIFSEVGATDAAWVWCPYVNPNGNLQSAAALYPGDAYVDWTCLDGYNRGTTASPTAPYRSFDYLFGPDYRAITESIAPSKPMLLGEVATSEHGGSKAGWISDMFARLPTAYAQVRGLMWFDYYDQGNDWPIETSTSATEAFAAGIGDPRYLSSDPGG
ncbi:MAG TPA: glycosyl hydrolase [Solirubrobacterales bacterium]|nr:glycosyl hydrolase [Solirubrobacterales bacterium]